MTSHTDLGLQAERTSLAWSRTSLAVAANAALLIRLGMHDKQLAVTVGGVLLGALTGTFVLFGSCRERHLCDQKSAQNPALVFATSIATASASFLVALTVARDLF